LKYSSISRSPLPAKKSGDPLSEFDANKMTLLTRESSMKREEGALARIGKGKIGGL